MGVSWIISTSSMNYFVDLCRFRNTYLENGIKSYMELDLTPIIITIVASIGIIFTSKTLVSHFSTGSKYLKSKIKEMEEYTVYQKKMIQHYKNKASNMEKPPQIEGDIEELDGILPEIVGQFAEYLPKWAQPLLKDQNAQKWLLEYVSKNPEKAKEFFGKMVGKKIGKNKEENADNQELLSV